VARLNIIICDLCKSISSATLPFALALQSGKGKDKEQTKAEICQKCYDSIYKKIESDFDFNKSLKPQPRLEKIEITEGESIVPSKNITSVPLEHKCPHDKTSFDPPNLRCRDCGEEWRA